MISPTYGEVTLNQVCEIINNYFKTNKHYNTPFHVERIERIQDVKQKLNYETQTSLTYADELIAILESEKKYEELYLNATFAIHIDAGHSNLGKTKDLIPALVGWIKSCGYDCEVKPDSYAASSVANKISK